MQLICIKPEKGLTLRKAYQTTDDLSLNEIMVKNDLGELSKYPSSSFIHSGYLDLVSTYNSTMTMSMPVTKTLNIDKIKDLEDVKRILKFLNIQATINNGVTLNGFDEVSDLFEP